MIEQTMTVKYGEYIIIGKVRLKVDKQYVRGGGIRVYIDAPKEISVLRSELIERKCDVCGKIILPHETGQSTADDVICLRCLPERG